MSWSLGETQALAAKAVRGAGYCWGLAEEAGFAVRWLQARNLPGAAAMAGYLERREAEDGVAGTDCPLLEGARLCDRAAEFENTLPIRFPALAFPLLLLPFAAAASEHLPRMKQLAVTWNNATFAITGGVVAGDFNTGALLLEIAECRIASEAAEDFAPLGSAIRVPDSAEGALHRLEDFATRTYAPASDRSRLTGAGAGTDDQD